MQTSTRFSILLACASLLPTACADEAADTGPSFDVERIAKYVVVSGGGWGCKKCGFTNSPILDGMSLSEATFGQAVMPGMPRLHALVDPGGNAWDVKVDHGRLLAVHEGDFVGEYDLEGWTLEAKDVDGTIREAEIYKFDWVLDWTDAGGAVPTYGLAFPEPDGLTNVCPELASDETTVVFINGERYDHATGEVIGQQNDVTTIACRGHALAKMAMLQHVPYDGVTDEPERQATLRMLRGDYCGDGVPHTVVNNPLEWTDDRGFVEWDPDTFSPTLEGYWTEDGALCVDTYRAGVNVNDLDCGISECGEGEFSGNLQGVWTTLVP
ncbi:MAG: ADYC domain-containing protein [Myxococcota bacterium]